MLPNFLVVGGQKCGTTSLHEYLSAHNDIYLPACKETHFFADPKKYEHGIEYYEKQHFAAWQGEAAVGEVDPDYMYMPEAWMRITEHLNASKLKIVVIVRNPMDRAYSHYLMSYRRGIEKHTFEKAIEIEDDRIKRGFYEKEHYSYKDRGFYGRDVQRILATIPVQNLIVIKSDDLRQKTIEVVERVLAFLDVDRHVDTDDFRVQHHGATMPRFAEMKRWLIGDSKSKSLVKAVIPFRAVRKWARSAFERMNTKKSTVPMSPEVRQRLRMLYQEDMKLLQEQTGLDLGDWM